MLKDRTDSELQKMIEAAQAELSRRDYPEGKAIITAGSGYGCREATYAISNGKLRLVDEGQHDNLAGNYLAAKYAGWSVEGAKADIAFLNSEGSGHAYDGCHGCQWTIGMKIVR